MYNNSIGYFGSLVYQYTNVKYIFIKINGIMKIYIPNLPSPSPAAEGAGRGIKKIRLAFHQTDLSHKLR